MVLAYLGRAVGYAELLRLLRISPFGAPAANIRLLTSLNLDVVYSKTDLAGLETMLQQGHPVIVFMRTGELPAGRTAPAMPCWLSATMKASCT
jgi:hypothetical protein